MDPVELTGDRVRLRAYRITDVDAMVRHARDPQTQEWSGLRAQYGRSHALRYALRTAPAGWRAGDRLALAIEDRTSGQFQGFIEVRLDGSGGGQLGYGVAPWARGRGIATEAARLALDWLFDSGTLQVAIWHAYVGDWAARRIAWKLGFHIEGAVRDVCARRGERRAAWIGSLLRDDPRTPATRWLRVPTLAGDGIVVRPWRATDAPACVEACNDKATAYWLAQVPRPYTLKDALGFIGTREEDHATGRGLHWAVSQTAEEPACGSFSFGRLDLRDGTAEIGYWVHPAYRGKGIAPSAVRTIVDWAFAPDGLSLHVVTLRAAVTNAASQRVAEKAGFRRGGTVRNDHVLGDGSRADTVFFDRISAEG